MVIWRGGEPPRLTVEFGGAVDPIEAARRQAQMERARQNSDWLQSHWAELLPQAQGKFVAVAGEEGFIADTPEEAWAWSRPAAELVNRSDSPWDSPLRRPSHADKRRAWRRELLGEEIRAVLRPGVTEEEIQATAERLLGLAA